KVLRKAFSDSLRDEAHDQTITMGELQLLVNPGSGFSGKFLGELAGRKHNLMITIRQVVAVHINLVKVIVEPYLLGLLVHLEQRAPVPETDILNRVLISRNHLGCQVRQRRVKCFLDRVEPVGLSGEFYVVLEIRGFQGQFVRLYREPLKESRHKQNRDEVQTHVNSGSDTYYS